MSSNHNHHTGAGRPRSRDHIAEVIIVCAALWLCSLWPPFREIAAGYFMLTPADLKMIPAGALLFLAAWQLLDRLLFAPYLTLLEAREASGPGAVAAARQHSDHAALLEQDFAGKLAAARMAAAREKVERLSAAKAEAAAAIKKAHDEALHFLDGERVKIASWAADLRADALLHLDQLVEAAAERASAPPAPPVRFFH